MKKLIFVAALLLQTSAFAAAGQTFICQVQSCVPTEFEVSIGKEFCDTRTGPITFTTKNKRAATINMGGSGGGIAWPASYYVTTSDSFMAWMNDGGAHLYIPQDGKGAKLHWVPGGPLSYIDMDLDCSAAEN